MSDPNLFFNFQRVLEAVPAQIDQLVLHLFPDARKTAGSYRTAGPEGGRGRSFSISTRINNAGCYHDFADPSVRGNAISLWALVRGCEYQEAGRALAGFLGVPPEERLHIAKKRPEPKIDRQAFGGLNKRAADYAASRGITPETLRLFRVGASATHIVFPHFDENDQPVMIKFWSCDGLKNIYSNTDPIPVLFGKHTVDPVQSGGMLIITEGHWDAMTWRQLGFPAVSIPNGVSNEEWIAEDWNFLNCFSEIYLDFDDDQPGREGEAKVRGRLGYERCRSVRYRHKDANAALMAGEQQMLVAAIQEAREAPIERIMRAADMKRRVKDTLNRTHLIKGTPFFLPKLDFEFRPYEMSLWFGYTSHGKSALVSQQIAFGASRGEMAMIASFEQASSMTLAGMLLQYTGDPDIGSKSHFDAAYDELASRVLFFDSMARCNPQELLATMTLAHKQLGICTFVIDNVMTLEVDRQDNTAQAAVADAIRVFVSTYPVHVHLVAHPRKSPDGALKPPSVSDIRGAAEWGDMPHNILVVYRYVDKHERLSTMYDEGTPIEEIQAFDLSMPDGKVMLRKQRENGELPITSYWFDKTTKRGYRDPDDRVPYFLLTEELSEKHSEHSPEDQQ